MGNPSIGDNDKEFESTLSLSPVIQKRKQLCIQEMKKTAKHKGIMASK